MAPDVVQEKVYVCVCSVSRVQLLATPWTVAHQAPLTMEFSRQKYWSGLLFPSPGDLPNPGVEPRSLALQADSLPSESYNIFSTLLPPYRSGLFMSFHSTVLFVFVCWPPDNNSRKKKKKEKALNTSGTF